MTRTRPAGSLQSAAKSAPNRKAKPNQGIRNAKQNQGIHEDQRGQIQPADKKRARENR